MRIVCWGQTVDSGATGASNLVMQPLGPRGSFLKHEVQDSENIKNIAKGTTDPRIEFILTK